MNYNSPLIIPKSVSLTHPLRDSYLREELHIQAWLAQKQAKGTKRAYKRIVKSFLLMFPNIFFKDVTTTHLVAFLKTKESQSASSQNLTKSALSSLLRYLVKIDYLKKNPADALDSLRVPTKVAYRSLTLEEVRHFIAVAKQNECLRDYLLIKFLFVTGVRVEEAVQVRWRDFRVDGKKVQIIVTGKRLKVRTLNIPVEFFDQLLSLKEDGRYSSSEYVFVSHKMPYNHLSTTQVWRIVKRIARKAKLSERIAPHFFRHAHAVAALFNGAPISVVQQSLGHTNLSVTGIYLEAFPHQTTGNFLPDVG